MTTNYEKIKNMGIEEMAQALVFDDEGEMRANCGLCAFSNNCNDNCYGGVKLYLESEATNE